MSADIPQTVLAIAEAVTALEGRALVVGGWVRDRLLGQPSKDVDVEVFGVAPDVLRELLGRFGSVNTVGESFTVYKVRDIDVAIPRRDSKTGRGHRGFMIEGDPGLTIDEASRRRDFTINAIAFDPLTGEYIDPHGGIADLRQRRLRAVDSRTFGEDSLRVMRALQFAARFDLTPDHDTAALCREIALNDLPAERIWGEFEKLLLEARRPSVGFRLALDLDVIVKLFPELQALVGCPQEPEWHPEGDVWVHTLLVVDEARQRIEDLDHARKVTVMLGALCHDLGKPPTTAVIDGRIRSMEHEQAGIEPAETLMDRLNIHSVDGFDVRGQVLGIVAHHLKPLVFFKSATAVGDGAFRRLAAKVDLELLARVAESDCRGRTGSFDCTGVAWFLQRARELGVQHSAPEALLKGRHLLELGLKPGPEIGAILRQVYERQLDGRVMSIEQGIAAAREILAVPERAQDTKPEGT
jgi:tRNA nucleotidyltransferase (CCA-adding enzyme)